MQTTMILFCFKRNCAGVADVEEGSLILPELDWKFVLVLQVSSLTLLHIPCMEFFYFQLTMFPYNVVLNF